MTPEEVGKIEARINKLVREGAGPVSVMRLGDAAHEVLAAWREERSAREEAERLGAMNAANAERWQAAGQLAAHLRAERDALSVRLEVAESERDEAEAIVEDLSGLVTYDGKYPRRDELSDAFSSVMDQWRGARAAYKVLMREGGPQARAEAIGCLYGALFPDETDEDAPEPPDRDVVVAMFADPCGDKRPLPPGGP